MDRRQNGSAKIREIEEKNVTETVNVNRNRRKRKSKCRTINILLAALMTFTLAGCGQNGAGDAGGPGAANPETSESGHTQGADSASGSGPTVMGRYVEEEIDLSGQLAEACSMNVLEDGSIAILDGYMGIFVSEDQGSTWREETPDWLSAMIEEEIYIGTMAMAPDGTAAVVYEPESSDEDYQPVVMLVLPDGTKVSPELGLTEEDMYVRQVIASEDGSFLANTFESIYRIHRDGNSERILTPEIHAQYIWVKSGLLFMDSNIENSGMPAIYDMETGRYIEDEVLVDFVSENYANRFYNGGYYGTMYLVPGEDGTVCVVGSKGIHRHALGGNMMEQIVDSNLSLLNNPNYTVAFMMQLEEGTFLALFTNNKMLRFTYDPDIPTVPENMLTIYSLKDDEDIRQAITLYQIQNPNTFVS